ncbi:hypothetical protein SBRY_50727 [Actinacidiphila bryophytorum]|uniref:Uncharacterized protein n=1 Tax=Actinacidiphila bryophytorum TaxID=1436133 RepID=A0A9W4MJL8_9ACTN|nr:hypothetical protein SBRY_50727 [Actinacidiphila bryophytorum]
MMPLDPVGALRHRRFSGQSGRKSAVPRIQSLAVV